MDRENIFELHLQTLYNSHEAPIQARKHGPAGCHTNITAKKGAIRGHAKSLFNLQAKSHFLTHTLAVFCASSITNDESDHDRIQLVYN